MNDENDVFVLDAQRIQMFSSNNKFVKEIPEMKSGNGSHLSHSPVYVVSDKNNLLYVSDGNAKCINVCDQDGHFYGAFGPQSLATNSWHPIADRIFYIYYNKKLRNASER